MIKRWIFYEIAPISHSCGFSPPAISINPWPRFHYLTRMDISTSHLDKRQMTSWPPGWSGTCSLLAYP